MATQSDRPVYEGDTFPATAKGFAALMKQANSKAGVYRLVTVVKLDKALAAIYERRPPAHTPNLVD